jgi:hypothetical protein
MPGVVGFYGGGSLAHAWSADLSGVSKPASATIHFMLHACAFFGYSDPATTAKVAARAHITKTTTIKG